jgi:hypothetical protein
MLSSWRMYEMHPSLFLKTGCYTRPRVPLPLPWGDSLDGERLHRRGAGWLCYALAADCGCPVWSLTAKALSRFGWTVEGPWAFFETRPCTGIVMFQPLTLNQTTLFEESSHPVPSRHCNQTHPNRLRQTYFLFV